MKQMIIEGNAHLKGNIPIGGAKNSVVALIPAAILADSPSLIKNVPHISDCDALIDILNILNCKTKLNNNELQINPTNLQNAMIDSCHSSKLRASYYFMGALLSRHKYVEICIPGGCNIGLRPIDMHIEGFKALGATIETTENKIILKAPKLKGADITIRFPSVGTTINIMLASVLAEGTTTIHNAAKEVEIENIADYLNKMGACITGVGTDTITIKGVKKLHGAEISVIPDRIEAGTYLILGALCGHNLCLQNIIPEHLESLTTKLQEINADFKINTNTITINKSSNLKSTNIKTAVYPGFPTDLAQPMSVLLTKCTRTSHLQETIWENRMGQLPSLTKMGANIKLTSESAIITGPTNLHGCEVLATDLRGGASLVLAGLCASGRTIINDADHILRGYENIVEKLTKVGAKIKIIEI